MPTKIEWCDETINPIRTADGGYHCTKVSEGCQNCYAERMNKRFGNGVKFHKLLNPTEFVLNDKQLQKPLHWKKPRRIFVQSMGDLFHEDVPDKIIYKIFEIMANAQWIHGHTFMVLTKRPQRMKDIIDAISRDISNQKGMKFSFPLKNIWLGVTTENQARTDERIPILLQIPAAVRFVSVEPMLGPVDLRLMRSDRRIHILEKANYFPGVKHSGRYSNKISWVICGGESGPGARPMHPDWVRSIRDQCRDAGTPFFFKQWGDWAPIPTKDAPVIGCADGGRFHDGPNPSRGLAMYRVGKKAAGYLLDGEEHRQFPEALMR